MYKLSVAPAVISAALAMSIGANAADLPARPAPLPATVYAPPPPVFSWAGFYLGGNLGAAWAHRDVSESRFGLGFGHSNDAVFAGGGQVGYNYQTGNFVFGVEAEFDGASNNNGGNGVFIPGTGTVQVSSHDTWITTVAARFGWAIDHWLLYGKAGGGWVGNNGFTVTNVNTGASVTGGGGRTASGFLVGIGGEYAFGNNWTAKIEYDYFGLGSRTFAVPAGAAFLAGDTFTASHRNVQTLKVGFNYLFNWGVMR
jgi:outer membrane immunogenic protein